MAKCAARLPRQRAAWRCGSLAWRTLPHLQDKRLRCADPMAAQRKPHAPVSALGLFRPSRPLLLLIFIIILALLMAGGARAEGAGATGGEGAGDVAEGGRGGVAGGLLGFLECKLCETVLLAGRVHDCTCDFETVDAATAAVFLPTLRQLAETSFFRTFKVALEKPCPFWEGEGVCVLQACSVCECDPDEVPVTWRMEDDRHHSGPRIRSDGAAAAPATMDLPWNKHVLPHELAPVEPAGREEEEAEQDEVTAAGVVAPSAEECGDEHVSGDGRGGYFVGDEESTERSDAATAVLDNKQHVSVVDRSAAGEVGEVFHGWDEGVSHDDVWIEKDDERRDEMVYVNLLRNPERHTGFSGPEAARIWRSVHNENCFHGDDMICYEKRVFYRILSGLQSSITTHIAREYHFPNTGWGVNRQLFIDRVGVHPERLNNLYFAYLVLLRAVSKAQLTLLAYNYSTGATEAGMDSEEAEIHALLHVLTDPTVHPAGLAHAANAATATATATLTDTVDTADAVDKCRHGFDESSMFQVSSSTYNDPNYSELLREKEELRREFMMRFRNISRIMDCITCEKCRLWGKLQILGLGTALKILFTPEEALGPLQRNEIIALINTLHQFAKSVHFVRESRQAELYAKATYIGSIALGALLLCAWQIWRWLTVRHRGRKGGRMRGSGGGGGGGAGGRGVDEGASSHNASNGGASDLDGHTRERQDRQQVYGTAMRSRNDSDFDPGMPSGVTGKKSGRRMQNSNRETRETRRLPSSRPTLADRPSSAGSPKTPTSTSVDAAASALDVQMGDSSRTTKPEALSAATCPDSPPRRMRADSWQTATMEPRKLRRNKSGRTNAP